MNSLAFVSRFFLAILLAGSSAYPQISFTDVSGSAGIILPMVGNGVTVLDFNGDGLEDLFFGDFGLNGRNALYKNLGNMQFQEIAVSAGIAVPGIRNRVAGAGDIDNDGDVDLFIGLFLQQSLLFLNNGDETFSNITLSSGVLLSDNVHAGIFFDCNRDGLLDLYATTYGSSNALYFNNGDNTFTDMAGQLNAGGPVSPSAVLGGGVFDFDRDGDDDIFMAQDANFGSVLLQQGPGGSFSDISQQAGVKTPIQGMGVAFGDVNRDGWPDVHVTNMHENALFINHGNATFTDMAASAGVEDTLASMGWGTLFIDADNDGWLDLYNNNTTGFGGKPNTFYRNNGNLTFEDQSISAGLDLYNDGVGAACADFDNDGDMDIVLADQDNNILLRNDTPAANNWVQFTLRGTTANRDAVGSLAELYSAAGRQLGFVSTGDSYASQSTLRLHFGLAGDARVDSLAVYWPGGAREVFYNLAANRHHTLLQGSSITGIAGVAEPLPQLFVLEQNYPNPFNPTTTIRYQLRQDATIRVSVFDLHGRHLNILQQGRQPAGEHRLEWQAAALPSGVYYIRLQAGEAVQLRKAILLK